MKLFDTFWMFLQPISLLLTLFFTSECMATITLDGLLDEEEWKAAQKFDDFVLVEPYTLTKPEFSTEVLIFTDETGIYLGVINSQPLVSRNNDTTARDQDITSDQNRFIIDFDGNGITAYSFEIGSGGSIRDGIFSNENTFSIEWDGNWKSKTSGTDTHWISETHLPWDVVSMKKSQSNERMVKWYFSRNITSKNHTYAISSASSNRQRFISEFTPLSINDFASSSIQVFAYATARNDFLSDDFSQDVGLDLFWKSGQGKQLSFTVNPDFGHIESDNLVVNFEPTEVFFNERRPFFTENQSLFDVRGAQNLRLLNTRRIGARSDSGGATATDIDAAVKFIDNHDGFSYGLFAATESDGHEFEGREFYSGRFIRRNDHKGLGFMATYTERPDIDRSALVLSSDYEYILNDRLKFNAQLVRTEINEGTVNRDDLGGHVSFSHQISPASSHKFELTHYGDKFDVQDFGYLRRNNLNALNYSSLFKFNNFSSGDRTQQRQIAIHANAKKSTLGEYLGAYFRFYDLWQFKDSSSLNWYVEYFSQGNDDLLSRGNGLLKTKSGYNLTFTSFTKNTGKLRSRGYLRHTDTYLGGKGLAFYFRPSYHFKDNYYVSLGIDYIDTSNWLKWNQDDLIGSYRRKLSNSVLDFNANISQRQELRFRFQWIAISAESREMLRLNNQGYLDATNLPINNFQISNTALQLRYRYEISPLSNIYVAYSRGGQFFHEENEGIWSLLRESLDEVSSNNFLVKVRYQFL